MYIYSKINISNRGEVQDMKNIEETVEKELKPYKGFNVTKIIDNKGTSKEEIWYVANDADNDRLFDVTRNLLELKKKINAYVALIEEKKRRSKI